MQLRDSLLAALSTLPGSRIFHLHVLVSTPRKYGALFPYASPRPRVYAQDILVLVSEQPDVSTPRVFVTAIEAGLYTIPQTASAILYIGKVDSTGQGARPAPTAALVRALVAYYVDPSTRPIHVDRVWVHVFARAQGQYLFPNSADHEKKKPLADVKLCAWWRRLLEQVVVDVGERVRKRAAEGSQDGRAGANSSMQIQEAPQLYHILPGMTEIEALQALGELRAVSAGASRSKWTYGHPYSQKAIPLPYVTRSDDLRHNLGQLIPSFDDDPKARFVDEIACTNKVDGVRSPKRKKRKTDGAKERAASVVSAAKEEDEQDEADRKEKEKERIHGELAIVSADEFWERMSFRQECIAGAVTGFFVAAFPWPSSSAHAASSSTSLYSSSVPQARPGQVSFQLVRRVVSSLMTGHEFSTTERSVRATEMLEGAIRGLCTGLPASAHIASATSISESSSSKLPADHTRKTPERDLTPSPAGLLLPRQQQQYLAPPQTPPPRLANGRRTLLFDDHEGEKDHENDNENESETSAAPVTSLETYQEHIYGHVSIQNPELPKPIATGKDNAGSHSGRQEAVTVLTVRKKIKQKR